MNVRTDIHRPSAIQPSEYEFVAFDYLKVESLGDALCLQAERERKAAHFAATGGRWSEHEHGGNCMVCGNANAIYTVCFYHRPTNVYLRVGQDCAEKMDLSYDAEGFNAFHASIRSAIERKAGKAKAQAMLDELGASRAWSLYVEAEADWQAFEAKYRPAIWEADRIIEMTSKLVKYGSFASDKQRDFFVRLATGFDAKLSGKDAETAQRQAEHDAAPDVPEGKVQIEGTILAVKHQTEDDARFPTTKMLVQHASGWKVWGSVPSQVYPTIEHVMIDGQPVSTPEEMQRYQAAVDAYKPFDKGDRLQFTATVTRSKDDSKFGFFSRPRLASRLTS